MPVLIACAAVVIVALLGFLAVPKAAPLVVVAAILMVATFYSAYALKDTQRDRLYGDTESTPSADKDEDALRAIGPPRAMIPDTVVTTEKQSPEAASQFAWNELTELYRERSTQVDSYRTELDREYAEHRETENKLAEVKADRDRKLGQIAKLNDELTTFQEAKKVEQALPCDGWSACEASEIVAFQQCVTQPTCAPVPLPTSHVVQYQQYQSRYGCECWCETQPTVIICQ